MGKSGQKRSRSTDLNGTDVKGVVSEVYPDEKALKKAKKEKRKSESVESADLNEDVLVSPRRTSPYMTKYEKTRILAQRAQQIQLEAPILISLEKHRSFMKCQGDGGPTLRGSLSNPKDELKKWLESSESAMMEDCLDPVEIAELELRERVLPMIVRRNMPDGTYEDWRCSELIDPDW